MPQTSITPEGQAFAGMLADAGYKDTVTGVNLEASAEMRFGIAVKQHATKKDGAQLITAVTSRLKGIVQHNHWFAKPEELGDIGLKPKTTLGLLRKGRIWVPVEAQPAALTDEVHVRAVASGGNTIIGAFTPTAEADATIDITPFASWVDLGSSGIACIEVDFPNSALATADA